MKWAIDLMIVKAKYAGRREVTAVFKKDSDLREGVIHELIDEGYTVDIIDERKIKIRW